MSKCMQNILCSLHPKCDKLKICPNQQPVCMGGDSEGQSRGPVAAFRMRVPRMTIEK